MEIPPFLSIPTSCLQSLRAESRLGGTTNRMALKPCPLARYALHPITA